MSANGENAAAEFPRDSAASRRRVVLALTALAILFVLVPFLFWRAVWFGRTLTDAQLTDYLAPTQPARRIQHALEQVVGRIGRGDAGVRQWYPQVTALARHEQREVRVTAAWAMGQDNHSDEFHRALLGLLSDPEPLVRQNAALALVRFGDPSSRPELRAMLQPFVVRSPAVGRLEQRLKPDDTTNPGTLLARIHLAGGQQLEVRSPLPGRVRHYDKADGAEVVAGDNVLTLDPAPEQVWESLRALYLIGESEDLEDVERYARGAPRMPERIAQQAALTAAAIRRRASAPVRAE